MFLLEKKVSDKHVFWTKTLAKFENSNFFSESVLTPKWEDEDNCDGIQTVLS